MGLAPAIGRRSGPARLRRVRLAGTALLLAGVAAYAASTIVRSVGEGGRSVLWDDWTYNAIAILAPATRCRWPSTSRPPRSPMRA